jgi:hypothetical protein
MTSIADDFTTIAAGMRQSAAPAAPEWPLEALEPVIGDLRTSVGILGHLISSRTEVEENEWRRVESDLITLTTRVEELWDQAWDQRNAERQEHQAAIKALKADKEAPGSPADVRCAASMWRMIRTVMSQAVIMADEAEAARAETDLPR